ncbi:hypothetical protein LTR56_000105 [Elasticomyces elasticus]|nr:hypothetical protein LTR56_000105 [Elasticomyces elasticus]KAK3667093.1 hypothetical protein LTR22_001957 [Elasticomyces elasticus]KAK4932868.1 hypothetical protein LTR49_000824 [Elasticomyces elasticus]KAK5768728.1 hypothetical protein LTS12_001154 [Elasticomyces elasticus]
MATKQDDGDVDLNAENPFRLLDLPDELWSRICRLAIAQAEPIFLPESFWPEEYKEAVCPPPITRVCKIVREEVLDEFYSNTAFHFQICANVDCAWHQRHADNLQGWLRGVKKRRGYWPTVVVETVWTFFPGTYLIGKLNEIGLEVKCLSDGVATAGFKEYGLVERAASDD